MAIRVEDIDLARDRELVEAWQAGDATAFDDLYRRYFDRLRAFCQRRVGDRAEAEELAQEAFVKALQALPRFDGERRFYPWMTVIASRLCIDHHRRRSRVEPSPDIDLGTVEDGHEERLRDRVDLDHLHTALGRLGPRHVEVLDLRERRGLTYDEIAGELGVPHSTVEALLFRARRALRREFQVVSAERLAGVPVIGWLIERGLRMRDRAVLVGSELSAIGAPIAAGAMTAVLVALPAAAPSSPTPVRTGGETLNISSTSAGSVPPTTSTTTASGTAPSSRQIATAARATVQTTSAGEAATEASDMPVHLGLGDSGIGVDPTPLFDQLSHAAEGNQP